MSNRVIFQFEDCFEKNSRVAYQGKAIKAVLDLFEGVNRESGGVTSLSRSKVRIDERDPIRNPEIISGKRLVENLHNVQLNNDLFPDDDTKGNNFLVEMETGTGKTYVYLRTMLELHKEYQFKKFILIVPSVAIREGVMKSIDQLKDHFATLYDGLDITQHAFVFDSKVNVNTVSDKLVESNDLAIMITTVQSITGDNKRLKGGSEESRQKGEKKNVWDDIKYIMPIVVVDESQKIIGMKGKSKGQEAIDEIRPQFTLHYTATPPKDKLACVYNLSSFDAFRQNLVKQIEVKTVFGAVPTDFPYVRFLDVTADLKAKVEMFRTVQGSGTVSTVSVSLLGGAFLYEVSGNLPQYKGVRIHENPNKLKPLKVSINGDVLEIEKGISNYDFGDIDITRKQIQIAIKNHFDRQFELLDDGHRIKTLALFFIDSVAKVRDLNAKDGSGRGEYLRMFDEEYIKLIAQSHYKAKFEQYADLFPNYKDVLSVREGYFAQDRNKKANTETAMDVSVDYGKEWDDQKFDKKTQEAIDEQIEKILKGKDQLIKFEDPLAFIFSHSALREGWDNPNIFTLCTLKSGASEMAKKQEIGRGLRLSLTDTGVRVYDKDINKLTVIVNDNYEHFVAELQKDFNEKAGFNKDEVTFDVITKAFKLAGMPKSLNKRELAEKFRNELYVNGIISDNNVLKKDADKIREINFVEPIFQEYKEDIVENFVAVVIERGTKKIPILNGDLPPIVNEIQKYMSEGEFESIWRELGNRLRQRTYYQVDIKSDDFINSAAKELNSAYGKSKITKDVMVSTGKMSVDKVDKFVIKEQGSDIQKEIVESVERKSDYEIVNFIMYHTQLPRLAIVKILQKFTNRDILNSQYWLDKATKIIGDLLTSEMAKKIDCYKVIDGYTFDNKTIFESESISREDLDESKKRVFDATRSRRSLHKYYKVDSDGEWEFARQLESKDNVLLYTKLKRGGFMIDTPYGHYSPDWAIVYKKEESLRLYFVVETKCDKTEDDISPKELDKIACAKKHFKAVDAIDLFDWVDGYDTGTKDSFVTKFK